MINDKQFDFFVGFLQQRSGYQLSADKKYLLESRLQGALEALGLADIAAVITALQAAPNGPAAQRVIEAMTINETFFFRDQAPFTVFENDILPVLAEWGKARPIRIWSAACSTGQEPYSLAMILDAHKKDYPALQYEILATDINESVLQKARAGVYHEREVMRGLPEEYRKKYFTQGAEGWKIDEALKRHIVFRSLNLKDSFAGIGPFDLVMLRNVLIYFDGVLKESILKKTSQAMRREGYLMLGAAEGIHDPHHYLARCPRTRNTYRHREVIAAEGVAAQAAQQS